MRSGAEIVEQIMSLEKWEENEVSEQGTRNYVLKVV